MTRGSNLTDCQLPRYLNYLMVHLFKADVTLNKSDESSLVKAPCNAAFLTVHECFEDHNRSASFFRHIGR